MIINITELNFSHIQHSSTFSDVWGNKRNFDQFQVRQTVKSQVEIRVYNSGMPLTTIKKKMKFNDGTVSISFGKNVIEIGKYELG